MSKHYTAIVMDCHCIGYSSPVGAGSGISGRGVVMSKSPKNAIRQAKTLATNSANKQMASHAYGGYFVPVLRTIRLISPNGKKVYDEID